MPAGHDGPVHDRQPLPRLPSQSFAGTTTPVSRA